MKYYHIVAVSAGLFLLQFVLQSVFSLPVPYLIRKVFFMIQLVLIVGYSSLMLMLLLGKKKQNKKSRENIVPLTKEAGKKSVYLKAS